MNTPRLATPKINPVIETIFQKLADQFENERRLREQLGHLELEREGLESALQMAHEHPDSTREVWSWLSSEFKKMNEQLAAMDAPLLRCVSYETFVAFLRAEITNTQA